MILLTRLPGSPHIDKCCRLARGFMIASYRDFILPYIPVGLLCVDRQWRWHNLLNIYFTYSCLCKGSVTAVIKKKILPFFCTTLPTPYYPRGSPCLMAIAFSPRCFAT